MYLLDILQLKAARDKGDGVEEDIGQNLQDVSEHIRLALPGGKMGWW